MNTEYSKAASGRGPRSRTAHVGLGSNVGRRAVRLGEALEELAARGQEVTGVSSLWLTEPVLSDGRRQGAPTTGAFSGARHPWYLNCVARLQTGLAPRALLDLLLEIERAHGRRRDPRRRAPEPRTLDLDLLLVGDRVVDEPGLRLPHPRLHERAFVLRPLAELDPDLRHPASDSTVADLLGKLGDASGCWLLASWPWSPTKVR